MQPFERSESPASVTRRDFVQASAFLSAALPTSMRAQSSQSTKSVIQILLVGGPSQLDTWDPKPDAPENVRGPFRAVATKIPGVNVAEIFPRLAQRMDRVALVRTLHHHAPPIHETGLQLLQTGSLDDDGERPHLGAIVSALAPRSAAFPSWVLLPGPLGNTGVRLSQGQGTGWLDPSNAACNQVGLRWNSSTGSDSESRRYGRSRIGELLSTARRCVEHGARVVTVNLFQSVFHKMSWDAHADGRRLNTTLEDYKKSIGPQFDQAFAALLDDLTDRGMLEDVLVVACGEMGRTPCMNDRGGRDHWPACWSALLAGGGIRGGSVLGASDRIASEPCHRPVSPAELLATQARVLGLDPATLMRSASGKWEPWLAARPLEELLEGSAAIAGFRPPPYTRRRECIG